MSLYSGVNGVKMMFCVVRRGPPSKLFWGGWKKVWIRLTDVAVGGRHMEHIVTVIVPSFGQRCCAETVEEGLYVV